MKARVAILSACLAAVAALGLSCSGGEQDNASQGGGSASGTSAAELRAKLNVVLAEHVSLAASATGAALAGRQDEFAAAAAALDQNSVDLAKIVGAAYGPDAETAFLQGWRRHIGFFVDYTQGAGANDQAKKAKAVGDLEQYARDVAELLNAASGLPKETVVKIVGEHVLTLTRVIDAQAAGNQPLAYEALRASLTHMHMLADPLAEATARKFPEKFASTAP